MAILKDSILVAAFVLWLSIVGAGSLAVINYGLTPGTAAAAPLRWPRASSLAWHHGNDTLVTKDTW